MNQPDPSQRLSSDIQIPTCHGGLEALNEEHSYFIEDIEGALPQDLVGTFYRNGPGRLKVGDDTFGHWFDGDGMICALSFTPGRAHFMNRYVRTPKYVKETRLNRIEYRGFGTQRPGGLWANFLRPPANPANTNTVLHGNKLLALNEGGRPFRLDPSNLDTIGEYNYEGSLKPYNVFSAHGKIDPRSGNYYNFGSGFGGVGLSGLKPCLYLYKISGNGEMVTTSKLDIESFPFCHDYVISDKYAVFFLSSIVLENFFDILLGRTSLADQASYNPNRPMKILIVSLDDFSKVCEVETEPGATIHFGNAWQTGDELFVDVMVQDNFDANDMLRDVFNSEKFGGGEYRRYQIDLNRKTAVHSKVCDTESEFPTFDTRYTGLLNRQTYSAVSVDNGHNSFFNGIQRVSHDGEVELLELSPGYFGSEPLFAPGSGSRDEGDGYILELVYNAHAHRSELVILSGNSLHTEVARLILKHHIPHQFHGFFATEVRAEF